MSVGQGQEDGVVAGQHLTRGVLDHALGQRRQVGVDRAELLPSRRRGSQSSDLDLGVREQQPEEFSPGIPTRSGDGNLDHAA